MPARRRVRRLAAAACLLAACSCAARPVAVPFYEGNGVRFATDRYASQVRQLAPQAHPLLLLVVARSTDEPAFREQMGTLGTLDLEALQVVTVTGSATSVDKQGYWLASEDAAALLGRERFRVLAVGGGGAVCLSGTTALARERIEAPDRSLKPELLRCAQGP